MRVLLDTHAFLWFIAGSPMLSQRAKTCIEDAANEKLISGLGVGLRSKVAQYFGISDFDIRISGLSGLGF